ncbi:MAG: MBG domain-containing protein, partial [Gillisia sp.]
ISTTVDGSTVVGTYEDAITLSGGLDNNYTFNLVTGDFTVTKAVLTAIADNQTKVYGAANPTLTFQYSGWVNGEETIDTAPSISTTVDGSTAVGTYEDAITLEEGVDNNYTFNLVAGDFTVTKALLTVTALDNSKFCGQVNPALGVSYNGFVNGDNENVLDTKPVASTTAVVTSTGSSYVIIASGGVDNNYSFTYVNGTLSVTGVTIDASASSNPVQVGTTATLTAQVTPAVAGVSVTFTLSEYNTTNAGTFAQSYTATTGTNGIATVTVSNLPSDVYKVTAVAGGGCASSEAYLPVYDPNGGFVTGGGWIYSEAGNMGDQNAAQGKANFGFNAKYKTGKNNMTEVDGNTNFQFQAGDLHLKSLSHDNMSLVISGAKATYRGVGTVNGKGNHKFLLVAIDGDVSGGGGVDKFRIKIWGDNNNTVIYDNQWMLDENSNDATILGGGSIVIHKPKPNNKTSETNEKPTLAVSAEPLLVEILESLAVAPNPVRTDARVRFSLTEDAAVVLRVYDFNGREVGRLFSGNVKASQQYEVEFQRNNLMSGVYILKLSTDRGNSYDRQIIIE